MMNQRSRVNSLVMEEVQRIVNKNIEKLRERDKLRGIRMNVMRIILNGENELNLRIKAGQLISWLVRLYARKMAGKKAQRKLWLIVKGER